MQAQKPDAQAFTERSNLVQRTLIFGVLTAAFCVLSYELIDRLLAISVALQIPEGGNIRLIAELISQISEPNHWLVIFVLALCFSTGQFIAKKHHRGIYVFTLSLFIAIVVTTSLKMMLARYRPELYLTEGLYGFHGFSYQKAFNSFPSGHVALNFAGLLPLAYIVKNKNFTIFMLVICVMIAIARILLDKHFLSDVVAGAYIGIFSCLWARYFVMRYCSLMAKQRS